VQTLLSCLTLSGTHLLGSTHPSSLLAPGTCVTRFRPAPSTPPSMTHSGKLEAEDTGSACSDPSSCSDRFRFRFVFQRGGRMSVVTLPVMPSYFPSLLQKSGSESTPLWWGCLGDELFHLSEKIFLFPSHGGRTLRTYRPWDV